MSAAARFWLPPPEEEEGEQSVCLVSVRVTPSAIPEGVYTLHASHHHPTHGGGAAFPAPPTARPPRPWQGRLSFYALCGFRQAEAHETGPETVHVTLHGKSPEATE